MQTAIPAGTSFWVRRLFAVTAALLLSFVFAQAASAQTTNQLNLFKNYFVTGDYIVGGVGLRGLGDPTSNLATGTINIPDQNSVPAAGVPAGADIVAAFLYWETVEKSQSAFAGQNGFFGRFNADGSVTNYAITGAVLGNLTAPPSWSSGGCSGGSNGNGTTTMRAYRADVRPFLPLDANGSIQTPNTVTRGKYQVMLADSGSNGGGAPIGLGATLVIIYRVQASPAYPLNSIVLYDGAAAPSNSAPIMSQLIQGFYQAAASPIAKITHIVGNGSTGKAQSVFLNNNTSNDKRNNTVNLPSLYPNPLNPTLPPFPGVYNRGNFSLSGGGSWDNPTWLPNNYPNTPQKTLGTAVVANDSSETVMVVPQDTSKGCVNWGAIIFSTPVLDTDGDGLLDAWEDNQGYTDWSTVDANGNSPWVALPGANKYVKDIFVEIDWLSNLNGEDGAADTYAHSHLPKKSALDMVGDAFFNAPVSAAAGCNVAHCSGINVHFDLGPGIYQDDKYVITYPVATIPSPLPPNTVAPPADAGGKAIPESVTLCNDATSPTLCAFPNTPTVGWKGGFLNIKNNLNVTLPDNTVLPLGDFQAGRNNSYHEVLFGHAMGIPESFWTSFGNTVQDTSITKLVSIVNTGSTTTITIQTPQGLTKPGDCSPTNMPPACTDANGLRVSVGGVFGQTALNGTYLFTNLISNTDKKTNVTTTTFNICAGNTTTPCANPPGVAAGTYNYSNEQYLVVAYGGPTSTSGRSDLGGGDSAVTLGLWPADDVPGCNTNPSAGPPYCDNQVGNVQVEAGTLLHEMGHTFFLTHGGTFFPSGTNAQGQQINSPLGLPSYGLNCNPGFVSSMSYLFQVRGFPNVLADGSHPIDYSGQTLPNLDEKQLDEGLGIGSDMFTGAKAAYFTRWYAPASMLDTLVKRTAMSHCDGSPILGGANMVRVDGSTPSNPIDWDNDSTPPETDTGIMQDVNFNGIVGDAPFPGFNDWINVDLSQVSSRANGDEFSSTGGGKLQPTSGGKLQPTSGGNFDPTSGGGKLQPTSGGKLQPTSGAEQDQQTACSTADPVPSVKTVMMGKFVVLNWSAPGGPCQTRRYDIWRAQGNFPTFQSVLANISLFTDITPKGITGTPPAMTFTDNSKLQNNTTYTYFVTDTNANGATSGASTPVTILVLFSTK